MAVASEKDVNKAMVLQKSAEERIFMIRGHRVMISPHLAEMYGVKVRALIQAVKRNRERFPDDFMFQLTWEETENSRSQIVILNKTGASRSQFVILKRGRNIKYRPYAFTEQGVSMLSSVLNSKQAIQVNIAIMRTFVKLRMILYTHKELAHKLNELEHKIEKHDGEIKAVFDAIREMMSPKDGKSPHVIGFRPEEEK